MEATKYQQHPLAVATTVDNIHVKYLRQKGIFNNLQEWMTGLLWAYPEFLLVRAK